MRGATADLDRALDGLVENAIVYSPAGTEVEIADGPGLIEVLDRGPGPGARRGGGGLRALLPRPRRQAGSGGDRARPADRQRARGPVGGSVAIRNRDGGGAVAELRLPEPVR